MSEQYSALIDGIYIKPIRTVIAVDDQFPTLDALLDSDTSVHETIKSGEEFRTFARVPVNPNEIGKARNIVAYCRDRQWIVDIHTGSKILKAEGDGAMLQHLHQTDLLILDYKLEGEELGGDHAIRILRALNRNEHFNIVVVYTKENPVKTFLDIERSILAPITLSGEHDDQIATLWQDWLDEDATLWAPLAGQIDVNVYRFVRRSSKLPAWSDLKREFGGVKEFSTQVGKKLAKIDGIPFHAQDVGWWLLGQQQTKLHAKLNTEGEAWVESVHAPKDDLNWLRTNTLFLTVVHKDVEGAEIIDHLRRALCDWSPSPHRLIVSSMRADLDDRGGAIEDATLQDYYLQAGLLQQLLSVTGEVQQSRLVQIVEHHWSQILRQIKPNMLISATRILGAVSGDANDPVEKTVQTHFPWYDANDASQRQRVFSALNSYASTQPVEGAHLTAGQVFKFNSAYWICLSPVCDLVPEQNKTKRWNASLGEAMPFKAAKLIPIAPQKAIDHATSNLCLFLQIEEGIECFSFTELSTEIGEASPHWEQMFADNQGRLAEDNLLRMCAIKTVDGGPPMITEFEDVKVVAQLKYEYALNLLQRLAGSLSRVGLDFVKPN